MKWSIYIYFTIKKNKSWSLADFGDKYCEAVENDDTKEVDKRKKDFDNYKSVLNSKSNEESLVSGEPLIFLSCFYFHHYISFHHVFLLLSFSYIG